MIVIGITGTKWKTTVTNIISRALQLSGKRTCMFSTANMMIDGKMMNNAMKMTSPSPFVLWDFLKKAQKQWCNYAVIETSSHALHFHRNFWLRFDVAVLTNIAQDHLDLHGTMEHYVSTKQKLFTALYSQGIRRGVKKIWVVNMDSPYSQEFINKDIVVDNMYTFWLQRWAQVTAKDIIEKEDGTYFTVKMPSNTFQIHTKLPGEFNVMNILAATCVLVSQQLSVEQIQKAIDVVDSVPWRMEMIPNNRWIDIFVDYAHTEDSLKNVLETLSKRKKGKIIAVFGATGDRDITKRPKMWRVLDKLSDNIIITDDDTYTEDSLKILRELSAGIMRKEGENFWIIPDRWDAIRTALIMALPNDVILIAGKWSETTQVTKNWPIPWNDREIVEKILKEIHLQQIPVKK